MIPSFTSQVLHHRFVRRIRSKVWMHRNWREYDWIRLWICQRKTELAHLDVEGDSGVSNLPCELAEL